MRRQLVDQNVNENDVIDAEHQLQQGLRGKSDPGLRVKQQFQHGNLRVKAGGAVDAGSSTAGAKHEGRPFSRRRPCYLLFAKPSKCSRLVNKLKMEINKLSVAIT